VVNRMSASDLGSQMKQSQLPRELKVAQRALACLTSILCRETGISAADAGCSDLSGLLAIYCPSHVHEPDGCEVPR
jgi:hypothetical protein